ncbi:MAG TPA: molybdenum ABC transporter ATP-binding protein [Acetobacteraceae bacterium]|nr:molybdenum ABC transporter ATP-binding protein [Acetobacteraceae bacterium]
MSLQVRLRHRFGAFALDATFEAPAPGVTALFGPSGSGKSTVISAVAGLLRPDFAVIAVGDVVLADSERRIWVPAERRRIGLVFQDSRLFPHLSVESNLRYGLRRVPRGVARAVAMGEVVELLGIGRLLGRRPATLSGGERQRVAIGRALLAQPRLLLMDEPLASLDAARKAEILPYLARLKAALNLPILYVTHALEEVARLADALVLIEGGRVQAAGPLGEVAARADLPLALRDDAGGVLAVRVAAHDAAARLTRLEAGGVVIWVPLLAAPPGAALRVRVPAREVILARAVPAAISVHNMVEAQVRAIAHDTARNAALVELAAGSGRLLARVTPDAVARLGLAPGGAVLALFKSVAVEVLE